jgi:hypothetical protein
MEVSGSESWKFATLAADVSNAAVPHAKAIPSISEDDLDNIVESWEPLIEQYVKNPTRPPINGGIKLDLSYSKREWDYPYIAPVPVRYSCLNFLLNDKREGFDATKAGTAFRCCPFDPTQLLGIVTDFANSYDASLAPYEWNRACRAIHEIFLDFNGIYSMSYADYLKYLATNDRGRIVTKELNIISAMKEQLVGFYNMVLFHCVVPDELHSTFRKDDKFSIPTETMFMKIPQKLACEIVSVCTNKYLFGVEQMRWPVIPFVNEDEPAIVPKFSTMISLAVMATIYLRKPEYLDNIVFAMMTFVQSHLFMVSDIGVQTLWNEEIETNAQQKLEIQASGTLKGKHCLRAVYGVYRCICVRLEKRYGGEELKGWFTKSYATAFPSVTYDVDDEEAGAFLARCHANNTMSVAMSVVTETVREPSVESVPSVADMKMVAERSGNAIAPAPKNNATTPVVEEWVPIF